MAAVRERRPHNSLCFLRQLFYDGAGTHRPAKP